MRINLRASELKCVWFLCIISKNLAVYKWDFSSIIYLKGLEKIMWDYSDIVKEHFKNPKNVGEMENADAVGEAGSLSCGDKLKL